MSKHFEHPLVRQFRLTIYGLFYYYFQRPPRDLGCEEAYSVAAGQGAFSVPVKGGTGAGYCPDRVNARSAHEKKTRICTLLLSIGLFINSISGQDVALKHEFQDGEIRYHLESPVDCPLHVRLTPRLDVGETYTYRSGFVIPPRGRAEAVIVRRNATTADTVEALARALENFAFDIDLGDPDARPDKRHRYVLPFAKGKAYRLIQGFNGSFSHNNDNARYALDFNLAEGDTICAARGGVVVKVREDFTEGGPEDRYRGKDNHILIYHDDGTLGAYAHLQHQGALVALGDWVEAGAPIGLAGATGYAGGPHLHFVVRQTTRNGQITLPVRFKGVRRPKEGKVYRRKE